MKVTRSYSAKAWFDKQSITFIFVSLLILYLFPSKYLLNINLVSGYVEWFMNVFRVFYVVATRSNDYESYAIYFASFSVLLPIYSYIYYKKPISINFDVINKNKIYYFLVLTIFVPFIVVGIIISLTHWDEGYTFVFIAKIISISSNSKIGLIFIFGGICMALCYFVAGYITWMKHITIWLADTEGCKKVCSIVTSFIALLLIVAYIWVFIKNYNSIILMLMESIAGESTGRVYSILIISGIIVMTALFNTACIVFLKHGIRSMKPKGSDSIDN